MPYLPGKMLYRTIQDLRFTDSEPPWLHARDWFPNETVNVFSLNPLDCFNGPCRATEWSLIKRRHKFGLWTSLALRLCGISVAQRRWQKCWLQNIIVYTILLKPIHMMASSNGNIFRVTGNLCGEFTGPRWIPRTKASDAELWCFLWSASQ